jgi:ABC-type oligopeptide transport system substrate-binding subunit
VANQEVIRDAMQAVGSLASIEAHEAVEKWGNLDDWHSAIGTGPFILKDFIPGYSATLVKNPNYWGNDEKNPNNKLPYIRFS